MANGALIMRAPGDMAKLALATPRGLGRAELTGCTVTHPKNKRKGPAFQFKVELAEVDSTGELKYIIGVKSEEELKSWTDVIKANSTGAIASATMTTAQINDMIITGLKRVYKEKMRPLEFKTSFDRLQELKTDAEFEAKPSVLLVGQYSVGKTTFIRNLVGQDFGERIGPEPTTDRFITVFHSKESRVVPGNTLVMQADKPYRALSKFGVGFLDKFEGSGVPSKMLENVTLVDTPGILAGEKQVCILCRFDCSRFRHITCILPCGNLILDRFQKLGRGYEFKALVNWFADRSDMVLLLFDANKLDISNKLCPHCFDLSKRKKSSSPHTHFILRLPHAP